MRLATLANAGALAGRLRLIQHQGEEMGFVHEGKIE
jgi:hypothetical protein